MKNVHVHFSFFYTFFILFSLCSGLRCVRIRGLYFLSYLYFYISIYLHSVVFLFLHIVVYLHHIHTFHIYISFYPFLHIFTYLHYICLFTYLYLYCELEFLLHSFWWFAYLVIQRATMTSHFFKHVDIGERIHNVRIGIDFSTF